ncbi:MAG: 5,6-dimethylbenzimidazole synthase [Halofilum sp. (in: g-proteobacteria)]
MSAHRYSRAELDAVYRVIDERRDMRHFQPDPVDPEVLARLLRAAHHAPSVGYMQPWRFVRVTDPGLRQSIGATVEAERVRTAEALGERGEEFMRLKVEGIHECGELLVVGLCSGRDHHIFGRRTLPEMDLASAACAIQNLWLAARAEGLGMGWVSLFDPADLARLLAMPADARPIAILCLGHVDAFYDQPMLEREHWAQRLALTDLVSADRWPESTTDRCGSTTDDG